MTTPNMKFLCALPARTLTACINQKVSFISKLLNVIRSDEKVDSLGIDSSAELTLCPQKVKDYNLQISQFFVADKIHFHTLYTYNYRLKLNKINIKNKKALFVL